MLIFMSTLKIDIDKLVHREILTILSKLDILTVCPKKLSIHGSGFLRLKILVSLVRFQFWPHFSKAFYA